MQNKKKSNRILQEYRNCFNYIKESKKFILIIIGIFFFFVLLGFFIAPPDFIQKQIMDFIKNLLESTKDMSAVELIRFITLNNLQSTLFGIFLGIILGIFPIISAISNGYLLGYVSSLSVAQSGILSLWKLLPHGIFEIPAVFLSLGLGLKLGTFIFKKEKIKTLKKYVINSLKVFLLIVIPLLIIAGIIEGILVYLL